MVATPLYRTGNPTGNQKTNQKTKFNNKKYFSQYIHAEITFLYVTLLNNFARSDCNILSVILDKELDWTNTVDKIAKTYRSI